MRILIVTHGFPPKEVTGTEQHSYILTRELSKRHEIHVFTRDKGTHYSEYEENIKGIHVNRIETPIGWSSRPLFENTYIDDRVALSFSKFIEDIKPQVIHVQHCVGLGMSIIEVAIQRNIPVLLFLHDFYFMCHRLHLLKPDGQICHSPKNENYCIDCISTAYPSLTVDEIRRLGKERYGYVDNLLSKIDYIVAPSQFVKKKFQSTYLGISNIIVSPLGMDLSFKNSFNKKYDEKFRFGYIGGIYRHKGIELLINAFKSLNKKNIELRIHGDGDPVYINELEEISDENVRFFGAYTYDKLAKVLSEIDVLALPSLCHESYSFTIREALAVGIPVIVSDIEAQSEAITEKHNGLCFKSGDREDLEKKMQYILENRLLYQKMSENAKKTHIVSISKQTEDLERLYEIIMSKSIGKRTPLSSVFPTGRPLSNTLSYIRALEKSKKDLQAAKQDLEIRLEIAKSCKKELVLIKSSLSYKFIRMCGSIIDRLFPEGTRRGEMKSRFIRRLQNITKE